MLPAGQNFKPSQAAGVEFDYRLETGNDLVLFQGATQVN
jgi:hypothetical protein